MSQPVSKTSSGRSSESPKSDGVARKRIGGPRSKSGCITCRIRHVKCDETRPACNRCMKTGRKCDGYQKTQWEVIDVSSMAILSSDPRTASDPLAARSFKIFESLTANNLAGLFDTALWQDILRASQHNDALYHAAIALGSAHEAYLHRRFDGDTVDEDRALKQYNKSIRCLTKSGENGVPTAPEVIMTASVLFMAFEMLRREYGKAIQHIQAGITIFSQQNARLKNSTKPELIRIEQLEKILRNLETHLCELSMEDEFPLMPRHSFVGRHPLPRHNEAWVNRPYANALMIPPFASIGDARSELDILWHNLMFVLHELAEPEKFLTVNSPEELMFELGLFREAFTCWKYSFDDLVDDLKKRPQPLKLAERRALAQLEMYQMTGEQVLDPTLANEMNWDNWLHGFERTLDLCDVIIENETDKEENTSTHSVFQLDHGIVTAAFHVIRKCRSARVRRRALNMLSHQRQDGLWDAELVQSAGLYIDEVERGPGMLEQAALRDAPASEIPLWRRIQGIDVVFSSAGREALITFFVPAGQADPTIVPIRKTIVW